MPVWTEAQQIAIDSQNGSVLVSAAAGSGKTAVLTARVLRLLTDEAHPVDVDELLLVTFTNAAAAEMRARIAAAITEKLAEQPQNTHLQRQLMLTHRAQITTVHSFCLQLVRENAAALGVAMDFRLMDEAEGILLRAEVLEELLEQQYEQADEGFFALTDLLTAGQSDKRLGEVILQTFDKIQAHPDPSAYLEQVRRGLYAADMDTPHGAVLRAQALSAVRYSISCLQTGQDALAGLEDLEKYTFAFTDDLRQAEALCCVLETGDWDACVAAAQQIRFESIRAPKGYEDKAFLERMKALRKEWKDAVGKMQKDWLATRTNDAVYDRALNAPALNALIDTVLAFGEAFFRAKCARNLLDFNDLEHLAVKLLYTDGQPSAIATALSGRFAEILVDEYQDTNAVQDAIFRAVSTDESNLFLVGDIKQSIYGFRLADPALFLEKYRTYQDATGAQMQGNRRIILDQNFRSRKQVLEACNELFRAVMGDTVGGMTYTDREALHPGAAYPQADDARYQTELLLAETPKQSGEEEANESSLELEARLVAMRIRALLREGFPVTDHDTVRPACPGDIVILLRSPKTRASVYTAALEAVGLSASAEQTTGLLQTTEVGTVVSLLSLIDNPLQDIDLIGVLRSPLIGFSEELLAEIRLYDRQGTFYDAMQKAAPDYENVKLFLQQLDTLRQLSGDLSVYQLLQRIFDDTNAFGRYGALPNGRQRQNNLRTFFERARLFERNGYRGLFAFVRLLRGMMENNEDFDTVSAALDSGAVRILSIHKSKGLEFPVVFVCGCASTFNEQDLRDPVLVHSTLGFGSKCRDLKRGVQYTTEERTAVAVQLRREMVSEEMRILYVAMTRAKEKLILTGASTSMRSFLNKAAMLAEMPIQPQYAMGMQRMILGWLLPAVLRLRASTSLREAYDLPTSVPLQETNSWCVRAFTAEEIITETPEVLAFAELPQPTITVAPPLDYQNAYLKDLPSKLTATGIGHGYRAAEAAEETPARLKRPDTELRAPSFAEQQRTLTGAEVGTAHHLFMQFCDYETCADGQIESEIARLAEKQILSAEQAAAIDPAILQTFFHSPLFTEQMAPYSLRREFKFSVLAPAKQYFPVAQSAPEEQVLLQGVIDVLIETPDGFYIVDYKTDRVSAAGAQARAESYRAQLEAYAYAVRAIFERPVLGRFLYFFSAGVCVKQETDEAS